MLPGYTAFTLVFSLVLIGAGILLFVLVAVTLLTAIRAMRTFTRAQELKIDLLLIEKD